MMNPYEDIYNRIFDTVLTSMNMAAVYAGVQERGGGADFRAKRVHDFLREAFQPVRDEMVRRFAEYTRIPMADIVKVATWKKGATDKTTVEGNVHTFIHETIYWAASSVMVHKKLEDTGAADAQIEALVAGISKLTVEIGDGPPTEEQARALDAYTDQIANLLPKDHPYDTIVQVREVEKPAK